MKNLQERRNVQSLLIFYKILNNMVDVSLPDCMIPGSTQTRGHNKKFIVIQSRIDAYKFSFFPRVISLWNNLPQDIVQAPTYEQFQDLLSRLTIVSREAKKKQQ